MSSVHHVRLHYKNVEKLGLLPEKVWGYLRGTIFWRDEYVAILKAKGLLPPAGENP